MEDNNQKMGPTTPPLPNEPLIEKNIAPEAPIPQTTPERNNFGDLSGMGNNYDQKSPLDILKNKKLLAIIGGVVILAGTTVGGVTYLTSKNSVEVVISANQTPFDLVANGQDYQNIASPITIKLKEGTYTITASKEGFLNNSRQISVARGSSPINIDFELKEQPSANLLLEKSALYPKYNRDTNSLLYFTRSEAGYKLMEYRIDTQEEIEITNRSIANISSVTWSNTSNHLAVTTTNSKDIADNLFPYLEQYPEETPITWVVTLDRKDLVNIGLVSLNPSIKNISFSPEGDKIAYFFDGAGEKVIATANNDGTNYDRIVRLESIANPQIIWSPDGSKIAIHPKQSENEETRAEKNDLFVYSFATGGLIKTSETGSVQEAVWANKSDYIAYEADGSLYIADTRPETSPDKKNRQISSNATLKNFSWINNNTAAFLDGKENVIIELSDDTVRRDIYFKKDSISGNITNIVSGGSNIYIMTSSGIYSIQYDYSLN